MKEAFLLLQERFVVLTISSAFKKTDYLVPKRFLPNPYTPALSLTVQSHRISELESPETLRSLEIPGPLSRFPESHFGGIT